MLKRYSLLLLVALVLVGCLPHHKHPAFNKVTYSPDLHPIQYRQVTPFNQVDAKGSLNMTLHTGYKKPQVILRGDPRDLQQTLVVVRDNTLFLRFNPGFPQYSEVNADVQGQFLNHLRYRGAGMISGSHLNTRLLDLDIENEGTTRLGGSIGLRQLVAKGDGLVQISGLYSPNLQLILKGKTKVQLTGYARLATLDISGSNWVSLYWVKSDHLTIRAQKEAKIQLAGQVNLLDVELKGKAQFKGRYLRAQRSFVKTHNQSVAEIASVKHQSSLATDSSNIYYYNLPDTRADFMAMNGSVLDMREWSEFDRKDFTRYNKQIP